MKNNQLRFCAAILLVALCGLATQARADGIVRPTGDGVWYYAIGGGDPMMYYHQSNKTTFHLGAGADWNLMRGCSFDPSFSISETFSDMKHNIYGLTEAVMASAISTFSAWGLQKVQESWPGLYDTLTKGLADAKESYTVSLKTCRDTKKDLEAGRNPVDGWIGITRKSSWDRASSSGKNPVEEEKKIEEQSGNDGVVWVNGQRAGGMNTDGTLQPPIRAVADTVSAGYSHLADSTSPDGNDQVTGDPNISRAFSTKEDAVKWVTEVIGEREIRTCNYCGKLRTKMGQGLRFQYNIEREKVSTDLLAILDKLLVNVDANDLGKLSVPSMGITINRSIIHNLQSAPMDERTILLNKLASEIALARAMEKALIARDLLNTGAQEPNIAAVGEVAAGEINYARERLQDEIDNVLFETEVRKKVITNAAGTIAARGVARNQDPAAANYLFYKTRQQRVRDGAIEND